MDYAWHYDKLIERARHRIIVDEYVEKHHVIPRCLGGSNHPCNLVKLTPEEHHVAHQLLHKLHPRHYGLLNAIVIMSTHNSNTRTSNKLYGWVKRKFSKTMKARLAIHHPRGFKGKKHSDQSKQLISKHTKKALSHICVPVYQHTIHGEFVAIYNSITAAAACANTSLSNIKYCCEGKFKHMSGWLWSYDGSPVVPLEAMGKKSVQSELGVFTSVSECMKAHDFSSSTQVRRRCLSDKYPKWKYLSGPRSANQ